MGKIKYNKNPPNSPGHPHIWFFFSLFLSWGDIICHLGPKKASAEKVMDEYYTKRVGNSWGGHENLIFLFVRPPMQAHEPTGQREGKFRDFSP